MKKSTVREVLVITGAGILAFVLYDFLVQPVLTKVVSGPPKQLR
jgi:hypothetical protein